jgi:hypothetical protein
MNLKTAAFHQERNEQVKPGTTAWWWAGLAVLLIGWTITVLFLVWSNPIYDQVNMWGVSMSALGDESSQGLSRGSISNAWMAIIGTLLLWDVLCSPWKGTLPGTCWALSGAVAIQLAWARVDNQTQFHSLFASLGTVLWSVGWIACPRSIQPRWFNILFGFVTVTLVATSIAEWVYVYYSNEIQPRDNTDQSFTVRNEQQLPWLGWHIELLWLILAGIGWGFVRSSQAYHQAYVH